MKKFSLLLIGLILSMALVGCATTVAPTERPLPVISGVEDKTIEMGSTFRYFDGITAVDADGIDITDEIEYSGSVNPNQVGTYDITYSVTDSKGATGTASCTITVVKTDTSAPMLTGVGDRTEAKSNAVIVGENFDPMDGVSAIDTIDGDLTESILCEGTVNIYAPGTYQLSYSVFDEAGNEATAEREIQVSLGAFAFSETLASTDQIVSGDINVGEYGYGIIAVNVETDAAGDGNVAISGLKGATTVVFGAGDNTVYLRYDATEGNEEEIVSLADLQITVSGATFVNYIIGVPSDITAPVLEFATTYDNATIYLPSNLPNEALNFILSVTGVKASDNRDGYRTVTLGSAIDFENTSSVQSIVLQAEDESGNVGEKTVSVMISDPVAVDDLNPYALHDEYVALCSQHGVSGLTLGEVVQDDTLLRFTQNVSFSDGGDGVAIIANTTQTQFYYDNKIQYLLGQDINYGDYYLVTITVKAATSDRTLELRFFQGINADPWSANFIGDTKKQIIAKADEWTTYYFLFKDSVSEADIYGTICELTCGSFDYNLLDLSNTISVKDFIIYALSGTVNSPLETSGEE